MAVDDKIKDEKLQNRKKTTKTIDDQGKNK